MPRTTIAEELQELRRLTSSGEAREIRIGARLSQADIARSIDGDPSTIARYERGERLPRGELALRYARLLARLRHLDRYRCPDCDSEFGLVTVLGERAAYVEVHDDTCPTLARMVGA